MANLALIKKISGPEKLSGLSRNGPLDRIFEFAGKCLYCLVSSRSLDCFPFVWKNRWKFRQREQYNFPQTKWNGTSTYHLTESASIYHHDNSLTSLSLVRDNFVLASPDTPTELQPPISDLKRL